MAGQEVSLQVVAELRKIRARIARCLASEHADRQLALEDVDDMLTGIVGDITAGRL